MESYTGASSVFFLLFLLGRVICVTDGLSPTLDPRNNNNSNLYYRNNNNPLHKPHDANQPSSENHFSNHDRSGVTKMPNGQIISVGGTSGKRLHRIKIFPKLLPFNSTQFFHKINSTSNNKSKHDHHHRGNVQHLSHPTTASRGGHSGFKYDFHPKNKLINESMEFADRPYNAHYYYPSWFPPFSDTKDDIDLNKKGKENSKHPKNKEDDDDCKYDSVETRVGEADAVFTGTIKKVSKGRQHGLRSKRYAYDNNKYNENVINEDVSDNQYGTEYRKYVYNSSEEYIKQLTNNIPRHAENSGSEGGKYNQKHEYYWLEKYKSPTWPVKEHPKQQPEEEIDSREFYDIAKIEIKRIIKGKDLLRRYIFEDNSLGSTVSKYFGRNFVTVHGLNNPSICLGSAALHDTRIFPVKDDGNHLILSFSMEKLSLNNLQLFDDAMSKEIKKSSLSGSDDRKSTGSTSGTFDADTTGPPTYVSRRTTTRQTTITSMQPTTTIKIQNLPKPTTTVKIKIKTTTKMTTTAPATIIKRLSIDIISPPTNQRIRGTTSALFFCSARAVVATNEDEGKEESTLGIFPEIEWFRNYKEKIFPDKFKKIIIREKKEHPGTITSVLRLEGEGLISSGMIECRVELELWEQEEDGVWVDRGRKIHKRVSTLMKIDDSITEVKGFPKININPSSGNLTILLGHPANLYCDGYSRSPPSITWYKDGVEPIHEKLNARVYITSPVILHFSEVLKEDEGLYECRVTNLVGTNVRSVYLRVTKNACDLIECSYGATCVTDERTLEADCRCQQQCHSERHRPVCGVDGTTYNNMCSFRLAQCQEQRYIGIQFEGPCKPDDPCENVDCLFGAQCLIAPDGSPTCHCEVVCEEAEERKVCGTDDKTYQSRCHLKRHSCVEQKEIFVKFEGPCDPCEAVNCLYGSTCTPTTYHSATCQCMIDCGSSLKLKKVCGSDKRTYLNECELERISCEEQRHIEVQFDGACDPCEEMVCHFGSTCVVEHRRQAVCRCPHACQNDNVEKICGTDGKNYRSTCEMERTSCEERRKIQIKFMGSCDPCEDNPCHYGSRCVIDGENRASCSCEDVCDQDQDGDEKVCGTDGKNYESQCELRRESCERQTEITILWRGTCDPCEEVACKFGSECVAYDGGRHSCECKQTCYHDIKQKICGSDGRTYASTCEMEKASCEQQNEITISYFGPCDLCEDTMCQFGSKCIVGDGGLAACHCPHTCEDQSVERVCGSDGRTYGSRCEMEKASCSEQREIHVQFTRACDPCEYVKCDFGSECILDEFNGVSCRCVNRCDNEKDHVKLCGSDGKTYESRCELELVGCFQQKTISVAFEGNCNPCDGVKCLFGSSCLVNDEDGASCHCVLGCIHAGHGKVCGSDGVTYRDECHVQETSCNEQRHISVHFLGPCDPCEEVVCLYGSICSLGEDGIHACRCPPECEEGPIAPVCGDDGRTYKAVCELNRVACVENREVHIRFEGFCDPCDEIECKPSEVCQLDRNRVASCACLYDCIAEVDPVCASDGTTYVNECSMKHQACVSGDSLRAVAKGECSSGNNLCMAGACQPLSKCEVDPSGTPRCFCPVSCGGAYRPVCASNGTTYDNECRLQRDACIQKVDILKLYDGVCDGAHTCKEKICRNDEVCVLEFGHIPKCTCRSCSYEYKPVCGSDMRTYTNECQLKREACAKKESLQILYADVCDLCKDVNCEYHGICNPSTGNCECVSNCTSDEEVCASNGMTYPSECYVNMMSCHSKTFLYAVHVGGCDPCIGKACFYGAECVEGECTCGAECPEGDKEEVCGNDGIVYQSECKLKLTSCHKQNDIQVDHVGACREEVEVTSESSFTNEVGSGDDEGRRDDNEHGEGGEGVEVFGPTRWTTEVHHESKTVRPNEIDNAGSGFEGSGDGGDDDDDDGGNNSVTSEQLPVVKNENRDKSIEDVGSGDVRDIRENRLERMEGDCTKDNCGFGGRCELDRSGMQFCNCGLGCSAVRSPVCGSDGKTYANECEMKAFSCRSQSEITVQSYEICDDFFEEICDGQTPLSDPTTNRPLDCLESKRCPPNSYCHVSGHVGRCCPEENGCQCHPLGSQNSSCSPITRQCYCKTAVVGVNCDRCNTNFWGIHKINEDNNGCLPCQCNKFGSQRSDCEQMTGRCICLEGVTGQKCDICANGKKLSKDGCVDERNRRSKPCPSDVTCRFGATCQMTPDGHECVCPDSCPPSDRYFADGVVCGTDNKVYASKCQLELMTCRLQMDIKVLSYGPCTETNIVDELQKKTHQSQGKLPGSEVHHVYPSFSSQSWMKLRKPQFASNYLTLSFEVKPSRTDGVIFYLGSDDHSSREFMALSLRGGIIEFRYDFGNGYSALKSSEKIRTGAWYRIVASKLGKAVLLTVDNQLPYTKHEGGSLHNINIINYLYLGYPPSEISREKVGLATGFQGCIKSLVINSSHFQVDYQLHNFATSRDIEEISQIGSCKRSACAKFPCEHGGLCFDINDGKSFRCKCKEGFSGANCHIESLLYPCQTNPCLNDGTCVATDDGAYECKCLPNFSGHHCHIRR